MSLSTLICHSMAKYPIEKEQLQWSHMVGHPCNIRDTPLSSSTTSNKIFIQILSFRLYPQKYWKITKLTMEEMKQLIERPLASLMQIDMFLKEWMKIKKNEIDSLICKVESNLENVEFKGIQDLMDAFSKWRSALGKS